MTDKKGRKIAYRAIKSTQIGRALNQFNKSFVAGDNPDYLVIPYVLTCAAYLEAKLNDAFQNTEDQYGEDFANSMQSLSLPNKIKTLVPVLTHGRYEINKEHFVYQRLIDLVRMRNALAHAKSELTEFSVTDDDLVDVPVVGAGMVKMPRVILESGGGDVTLGASATYTPLEYHDALNKLEKWFFHRCPDKLAKVAMVVDRTKKPGWKEVASSLVKHLDDKTY
jgi:hypothetical protein